MIPPSVTRWVPLGLLVVFALVWTAYLVWAVRRARLASRPILLATSVLGVLPRCTWR